MVDVEGGVGVGRNEVLRRRRKLGWIGSVEVLVWGWLGKGGE